MENVAVDSLQSYRGHLISLFLEGYDTSLALQSPQRGTRLGPAFGDARDATAWRILDVPFCEDRPSVEDTLCCWQNRAHQDVGPRIHFNVPERPYLCQEQVDFFKGEDKH